MVTSIFNRKRMDTDCRWNFIVHFGVMLFVYLMQEDALSLL